MYIRHVSLSAAILALALIAGCDNPEKWKFNEDVVLNTGESLQVERVALRNNVWPHLGNDGYQSVVNQWLTLPGSKYTWNDGPYKGSPMSIGKLNGQTVLATEGGISDESYCTRHPDHYLVQFWQLAEHGWEKVNQSDELLDQLTANLLIDLEWGDDPSAKVAKLTLQQKSSRSRIDFQQPRSIRQALDHRFGSSCATHLELRRGRPASAAQSTSTSSP